MPPGTPPCASDQLAGAVLVAQGATGNFIAVIGFGNSGPAACYLDGSPSVTLIDAAGNDAGFRQRAPYMPAGVQGPALVDPGPAPQPLDTLKEGQAKFNLDWVTQPEACLGEKGVAISAARIALTGGGTLTVPLPPMPDGYRCQGVGVSSFEGPQLPDVVAPPPALPGITIEAPAAATRGKSFDYVVTLTNDTQVPMNLAAQCPNYEEELLTSGGLPLGGKHIYRLNCAPAGTLAAGASARFAMSLDVPANAPADIYRLMFNLGYSNAMTQFGKLQPVLVPA